MNAAMLREIGRDMQGDADPTIQAAGEFVLDVADGLGRLTGADQEIAEHASSIASAYAEDPGPVPEGAS